MSNSTIYFFFFQKIAIVFLIYIAIANFRLSNKITETQGLNHVCPSIIFIAKDNVLNWCVITRVHLHCDWSCWWFTVRGNCQLFSGCKNSSIYCQRSLLTLTLLFTRHKVEYYVHGNMLIRNQSRIFAFRSSTVEHSQHRVFTVTRGFWSNGSHSLATFQLLSLSAIMNR